MRILNENREKIPVILEHAKVDDFDLNSETVWITGKTKPQLIGLGLEVLDTVFISWSLYGYLVYMKQFMNYLAANNFPMLIYRLGR